MVNEKIIQWTCRGIKSKYEEVKRIITDFSPLVMCVQETHLNRNDTYNLRGYTTTKKSIKHLPGGRAHGGVAIFTRNNVKANEIRLTGRLLAVAVRVKVPFETTICSIYLPDGRWKQQELLDLIKNLPPPIILAGDFNSHNTLWGSDFTDTRGNTLENIINDTNLTILNSGSPTHINAYSGKSSAIDLTIASPSLSLMLDWRVLPEPYFSDHYPISISLSTQFEPFKTPSKFNTKKADWSKYQSSFVIPQQADEANIDKSVDSLTKSVIQAAETSIPMTSNKMKRKVPWWNDSCQKALKEKKKALKRFNRYPTIDKLEYFKIKRASARKVIQEAKKSSLKEYVSSMNESATVTEVWHKIRSITGKRQNICTPMLLEGGTVITKIKEVADCLGRHYSSIYDTSSYTQNFVTIKREKEQNILDFGSFNDTECYNKVITMDEFTYILSRVKDTSPGPDKITYTMIAHLPDTAKQQIIGIYNDIYQTGRYPNKWKEAIIIPIIKEGKDPAYPASYRPIALTNCLGKIFEAIINQRLIWFLETNNLINRFQAGFRRGYSCIDQLCLLENNIQDTFLRKNHGIGVFFDIERAFDTTWRYFVLKQCHDRGLRGNLPWILQSFLSDRKFRVRVGEDLSESYDQINGIPQGSVLSVTLFGIAINNITDGLDPEITRCLYVDDLCMYLSGDDILEVGTRLQAAIDSINSQAENIGFCFSQQKTKCVHFCRRRSDHCPPPLYLKGSAIPYAPSTKYLGMILDERLSWSDHILMVEKTCKKTLSVMKFLGSVNWGADKTVLLKVFETVLCSKLNYGVMLYSSARRSRLRPLNTIYNCGLRIATGAFRTSPLTSIYCEAGFLPPEIRRLKLSLTYAVSVWGKPQHFIHNVIFDEENSEQYRAQRTKTRPLRIRMQEVLEDESIQLLPVKSCTFPSIAPWVAPNATVQTELSYTSKSELPPYVLKKRFLEIEQKYSTCYHYYTDGSKTELGVGSAVFSKHRTCSLTLQPTSSVFTAEIMAIIEALKLIRDSDTNHSVIFSDSLSAINFIKKKFNFDPYITEVYSLLHEIKSSNKTVVFIWIPSHIGIEGNDKADALAKIATTQTPNAEYPMRTIDLKNSIKKFMQNKWETQWRQVTSKFRSIKISADAWEHENVSRRDQVVLTRLRIGHSRLTHVHLLINKRPPKCPMCATILTTKHILEECQPLQPFRIRHCIPADEKLLLKCNSNHQEHLINYLKSINVYHRL